MVELDDWNGVCCFFKQSLLFFWSFGHFQVEDPPCVNI
jgi:hypothetical protein